MEIKNICRSCLQEHSETYSIFEYSIKLEEAVQLKDIIKSITNIEVEVNDGLPDKLCEACLDELNQAYKFIIQFQNSDKKLRTCEESENKLPPATFQLDMQESEINNKKDTNSDIIACDIDNNEEKQDITNSTEDSSSACDNSEYLAPNHYEELNNSDKDDLEKRYICGQCSEVFTRYNCLKNHLRTHFTDADKPFSCTECDAKYAYEFQLTQHSYKHKEQKPFPCKICDRGCLTAQSLKRHMKVHDKNYNEKKSKHVCPICQKEFCYRSFLAEHMKNHSGEKPFLCSYCGKSFRQKGQLAYHVRIHTGYRPFTCEVCNVSFTSHGILKIHLRRHTNERPYVCDICGRAFRQSSDMQSHKRIHLGIKKVECSVCQKKMSTTGQLTIHMRMHTGEKPFSCLYCSRAFATRALVVKHTRIHTGEKPYVCPICNKAFSQNSAMKTHLKTHDKNNSLAAKKGPKQISIPTSNEMEHISITNQTNS